MTLTLHHPSLCTRQPYSNGLQQQASYRVSITSAFQSLPSALQSALPTTRGSLIATRALASVQNEELTEIPLEDIPEGLQGKVNLRSVSRSLLADTLQLLEASYSESELRVIRLLLCVGLSKQQVARAIAARPSVLKLTVPDILLTVQTMVQLGATLGESITAILLHPELVAVPTSRFQTTVDRLEELGVAPAKVYKVFVRFPGIFKLSEDEIEPSVAKLQYLVGTGRDVMRMVERQPRILGLTEEDIAAAMDVLRENIKPEALPHVIEQKPQVLLMSPEAINTRFKYLSTVFHRRRISQIFRSAPGLLTIDSARLKQQYARLVNYLDEQSARKIINNFPQALTLSWDKVLMPKFQYLADLGLDRFEVLNFPAYLGYSLNARIRPRCKTLLQAGYQIKSHDQVMRVTSERRSDRRVGRTHYELLQEYGDHCVAIQHIVGLTDLEFRSQFGVEVVPGS